MQGTELIKKQELKRKLFIDGNWIESAEYQNLYSPYSGEKIAEVPVADTEHLSKSLLAAKKASIELRALSSYEKASILRNVVEILQSEREDAAQIISMESAKPLKYSLGEVDRTIETYLFAAEEAKRITGEMVNMDGAKSGEGKYAYTLRTPIGVIGAITPFNFPMNLVAHKIGPALASGNAVILKPASQTPLSAYYIADVFQRSGVPNGALNVITGSGSVIGSQMVSSPDINMITFTGSPEVGLGIKAKAGLKKVSLELGSNAGLIVDDGINIDTIIKRAVDGAFSNQGQVCISLQRIYIHENLYQEFLEKFVHEAKRLILGDPLAPDTDISALISQSDTDRSLAWIREAVEEGAVIETGGKVQGNILEPTVLTNVNVNSKVCSHEVFSPIVIIQPIKSVEEGIEMINNSRFGLQAGIYTDNISSAHMASNLLEVGGVIINDIPTFRVDQMPYGGVKESGNTKEGIKYAIEEMTNQKLIVWNDRTNQ